MARQTVFIDCSRFHGGVFDTTVLNELDLFVWRDDKFDLYCRPSFDISGDGELPVRSIEFDNKCQRYRVNFEPGAIIADSRKLESLRSLKLVEREAMPS